MYVSVSVCVCGYVCVCVCECVYMCVFGARWRKLFLLTEFNGMGGSDRVMR